MTVRLASPRIKYLNFLQARQPNVSCLKGRLPGSCCFCLFTSTLMTFLWRRYKDSLPRKAHYPPPPPPSVSAAVVYSPSGELVVVIISPSLDTLSVHLWSRSLSCFVVSFQGFHFSSCFRFAVSDSWFMMKLSMWLAWFIYLSVDLLSKSLCGTKNRKCNGTCQNWLMQWTWLLILSSYMFFARRRPKGKS
jgi:hypothetical protein